MGRKKKVEPSGEILKPIIKLLEEKFDITKEVIESIKVKDGNNGIVYVRGEVLRNIFYSEERCNINNYNDLILVLKEIAVKRKYENEKKIEFDALIRQIEEFAYIKYNKDRTVYPFDEKMMIAFFENKLSIDELVTIDYFFDIICSLQHDLYDDYVDNLSMYTDEYDWYVIIKAALDLLSRQEDCLQPLTTRQIAYILRMTLISDEEEEYITKNHEHHMLEEYNEKKGKYSRFDDSKHNKPNEKKPKNETPKNETPKIETQSNKRMKVLKSIKDRLQQYKKEYPEKSFVDSYNIYYLLAEKSRIPLVIVCMCLNCENRKILRDYIDNMMLNVIHQTSEYQLLIRRSNSDN